MTLFGQLGDPMSVALPEWREILSVALAWGWRPAGTSAPPPALDVDVPRSPAAWDAGDYRTPQGQVVGRQDALALGGIIQRALNGDVEFHTIPALKARRLALFCQSGPFLIGVHEAGKRAVCSGRELPSGNFAGRSTAS